MSKLDSSLFIFDLVPMWFHIQVIKFYLRIYKSSFYSISPWQSIFLWPWHSIPLFTSSRFTFYLIHHLPPHDLLSVFMSSPLAIHSNTSDQCLPCDPVQITVSFWWLSLPTPCLLWWLLVCFFLSFLRDLLRSHPILNDRDMTLSTQHKSSRINK